MYFIKMHLGSEMGVWFQKLFGIFCWVRTKKVWRQNGAT
jgi:hypothetical protein